MTSEQLFAAMPVDLAMDILDFVAAEDRPLYKTALEAVAQTRKVRGVFLARQPKVERHKTM
ncbi:MAG TPA: hypothetical protein VNO52_14970, partial [Methylomirabilota bacterium]|nr:hypothetical protein [Methylomirabilota bacterium]